ncbi:MAG: TIGR02996 domain-containing protein [Archangium sp.]
MSVEDELWARVYAQPEDLDARLVLADALSERGDARGHFIARQIAGDDSPPDDALLAALLGPLAPSLRSDSVRFENGFPVEGTMARGRPSALFTQREWSTFKSLRGLDGFGPQLKSLEEAHGVSFFALGEWARHGWSIPVRTLGTQGIAVMAVAELPCVLETLNVEHIVLSSEFELGHVYEALREVPSLTTLRIAAPIFTVAASGARWPRWNDGALSVPSLRTIEWSVDAGLLVLSSVDARFDSLTLRGGDASLEAELRTLGTPARRFSVE